MYTMEYYGDLKNGTSMMFIKLKKSKTQKCVSHMQFFM
jgi:hypothetical protein